MENKITLGGEFKEPEASLSEWSSMCKSSLNAQAQEIIPVSEQQMDSYNYQIMLHSAVIYMPSPTQILASSMSFYLFILPI